MRKYGRRQSQACRHTKSGRFPTPVGPCASASRQASADRLNERVEQLGPGRPNGGSPESLAGAGVAIGASVIAHILQGRGNRDLRLPSAYGGVFLRRLMAALTSGGVLPCSKVFDRTQLSCRTLPSLFEFQRSRPQTHVAESGPSRLRSKWPTFGQRSA